MRLYYIFHFKKCVCVVTLFKQLILFNYLGIIYIINHRWE